MKARRCASPGTRLRDVWRAVIARSRCVAGPLAAVQPDRAILTSLTVLALTAVAIPLPALALERIYLVRHAEKLDGWPQQQELDAYWPLSVAGTERAQRLAQRLADKGIVAVYASPTTRALATGLPLSLQVGCPLSASAATTDTAAVSSFLSGLLAQHAGPARAVLVVGHANTIPMMLRALGATHACDEQLGIVKESWGDGIQGFDGLWTVELRGEGCARFQRETLP
jgi:phosphohistidine phosphatase SixA